MRWVLVLLAVGIAGEGCQQSSSAFVTREELRDLLVVPAANDPADHGVGSEERRQRLELLMGDALTAPEASTRAAAAMAVASDRTALLTAALAAIDQSYRVCANNLANLETTAFKASYAVREAGRPPEFRINFEQGSLEGTGRQLDLAISGQGFFKVKILDSTGNGFGYTRNGNFFVNKDGDLVLGMADGYQVKPGISVPKGTTDVSISQDGVVEVAVAGTNAKRKVGQLEVVQFMNPQGLNLLGGSIYIQTDASGAPIESKPGQNGAGAVIQGFLEGSNVDPNKERLRMRFLANWRTTIMKVIDEMK